MSKININKNVRKGRVITFQADDQVNEILTQISHRGGRGAVTKAINETLRAKLLEASSEESAAMNAFLRKVMILALEWRAKTSNNG